MMSYCQPQNLSHWRWPSQRNAWPKRTFLFACLDHARSWQMSLSFAATKPELLLCNEDTSCLNTTTASPPLVSRRCVLSRLEVAPLPSNLQELSFSARHTRCCCALSHRRDATSLSPSILILHCRVLSSRAAASSH